MADDLSEYRDVCEDAIAAENAIRTQYNESPIRMGREEIYCCDRSSGYWEDDLGSSCSTETVPLCPSPRFSQETLSDSSIDSIRRPGIFSSPGSDSEVLSRLGTNRRNSRPLRGSNYTSRSTAYLHRKRIPVFKRRNSRASNKKKNSRNNHFIIKK